MLFQFPEQSSICDFRPRHSCSNFIKRLGIGIGPGNETKNSSDSEPVFVYHWGDITILAHRTLISHCMIARDRVQFMRSLLTVLGQVTKGLKANLQETISFQLASQQ